MLLYVLQVNLAIRCLCEQFFPSARMQAQKNEVTNNFRKIEKLCSMLKSLSSCSEIFPPLPMDFST